jgi:hypothetical protein
MNSIHMIKSLMNTEKVNTSSISFKPGQLLYGRVEKILPNDTAVILIGGTKIFAQLKTALSASENYWFEVQSNGIEGIELKVAEGLHATKKQLEQVSQWELNPTNPKEAAALEWMLAKDLPFTEEIFKSLVAAQENGTIHSQLANLQVTLDNPKFNSLNSVQELKQLISLILTNYSSEELGNGKTVMHLLHKMVGQLGLQYESELNENQNSLKPMLLKVIRELGAEGRNIEPILNRLTGMQLLSPNQSGPMQQIVMQLPITYEGKQTDVTLQLSGRKNNKGQIDPDYCRILFYLDLKSIHETVIDMQIQNRVIHATIINDENGINTIITALTPSLKDKLESLGYKLSFLKVSETSRYQQTIPNLFNSGLTQGVDIRV